MSNKKQYTARKVDHKKGFYRMEIIAKFVAALKKAVAILLSFLAGKKVTETGETVKANCAVVSISNGNRKMGEIASVSLLPFLTCPTECKDTCDRYCYAAKTANLYPNVRDAWARNTALAFHKPELYWQQVNAAIARERFFRFHVSGDVPNMRYLEKMVETARNNPHCEILVFTKRHVWFNLFVAEHGGSIEAAIPSNLHIMYSGEKNLKPVNPYNFPETVVIGKDEEIPENVIMCGGSCEHCFCGGMGCIRARQGETVGFIEH